MTAGAFSSGRAVLSERVRVAELPEHVVLTREEVAAWLAIRPRQVERLGIPSLNLSRKTKRYLKRDVLEWLNAQRENRQQIVRSGA